jgi:hypothetical protein
VLGYTSTDTIIITTTTADIEWSDEMTADSPRKLQGSLRPVRRPMPESAKGEGQIWIHYRFLEFRVSIDPDQRYINERMSFDFSLDPSRN